MRIQSHVRKTITPFLISMCAHMVTTDAAPLRCFLLQVHRAQANNLVNPQVDNTRRNFVVAVAVVGGGRRRRLRGRGYRQLLPSSTPSSPFRPTCDGGGVRLRRRRVRRLQGVVAALDEFVRKSVVPRFSNLLRVEVAPGE